MIRNKILVALTTLALLVIGSGVANAGPKW
jgi:hypothetical protein